MKGAVVFFPEIWMQLQARMAKNHPDLWRTVQSMERNEGIAYLNSLFGTQVAHDETLERAGEIFMKELLKREGTIIIPGKGYSK